MVKKVAAIVLTLGMVGVSAHRRDSLAKFEGAIGVIPVSNGTGPANQDGTFPNVTRNVVRGVNPSGQIWRIADLKADVDNYGHIKVRGRGLLFGGGNNIGQNGNQRVFATLICEATALRRAQHQPCRGCARTQRRFSNRRYFESIRAIRMPEPGASDSERRWRVVRGRNSKSRRRRVMTYEKRAGH
jgi:hypothetical protein